MWGGYQAFSIQVPSPLHPQATPPPPPHSLDSSILKLTRLHLEPDQGLRRFTRM